MNPNQQEHSYEELREIVINILLISHENGVDRFEKLLERTGIEIWKQEGVEQARQHFSYGSAAQLHPNDIELLLEIVWDLFRQGIVTFGLNASNPGWPWLRLSRFGECSLQQGLYRFHNKAEFIKALNSESIDISSNTSIYAKEAVAAYFAGCLLSSCVMLGFAAESEFTRVLDIAKNSQTYGKHFARIGEGLSIRAKILRFGEAVKPLGDLLPGVASGELGDALNTMQSIMRSARNEAGQPSGADAPSRDQVYVYMQLFIPFAEQMMRLRRQLTEADYPRLVSAP